MAHTFPTSLPLCREGWGQKSSVHQTKLEFEISPLPKSKIFFSVVEEKGKRFLKISPPWSKISQNFSRLTQPFSQFLNNSALSKHFPPFKAFLKISLNISHRNLTKQLSQFLIMPPPSRPTKHFSKFLKISQKYSHNWNPDTRSRSLDSSYKALHEPFCIHFDGPLEELWAPAP